MQAFNNYIKQFPHYTPQVFESVRPLELMLLDPQIKELAKEMDFDMDSAEAKDIASRVKSVSLSASK